MQPSSPTIHEMEIRRDVAGLIHALAGADAEVRRAAADALGNLGDPCAVEALCAATDDSCREVCCAAFAALEKIHEPQTFGIP